MKKDRLIRPLVRRIDRAAQPLDSPEKLKALFFLRNLLLNEALARDLSLRQLLTAAGAARRLAGAQSWQAQEAAVLREATFSLCAPPARLGRLNGEKLADDCRRQTEAVRSFARLTEIVAGALDQAEPEHRAEEERILSAERQLLEQARRFSFIMERLGGERALSEKQLKEMRAYLRRRLRLSSGETDAAELEVRSAMLREDLKESEEIIARRRAREAERPAETPAPAERLRALEYVAEED